VLAIEGHN